MIKYYTKAWLDECARRIQSDAKFEQEGKKLSGIFTFRVYDGPDGKDRMMEWTFKQGKLVDWKYDSQPTPWQELRNTPFNAAWMMRATCPYNMMAALNKGEMAPMRALTSPHYQIEGNKVTLMQLMRPVSYWNQICASVETNYDYTDESSQEGTGAEGTVTSPEG
ncbi:MAG: hypothetical protein AB1489_00145 [Acidobacteriota bacterium]